MHPILFISKSYGDDKKVKCKKLPQFKSELGKESMVLSTKATCKFLTSESSVRAKFSCTPRVLRRFLLSHLKKATICGICDSRKWWEGIFRETHGQKEKRMNGGMDGWAYKLLDTWTQLDMELSVYAFSSVKATQSWNILIFPGSI